MGTLVEEIIGARVGRTVRPGDLVVAEVDFMMSHDNTTPLAIQTFRATGRSIKDPSRIVIHFDHAWPPPNPVAAANQKKIRDFIRKEDLPWLFHEGICHQVMIEKGFVRPGSIIMGGDSHSVTYGAFGALGCGFGSTDIGAAWTSGKTWLRVPSSIRVNIEGTCGPDVEEKDVMLEVCRQITMDGGTYRSIEFGGSFIDKLPMERRILFSNMTAEVGAMCGLIAADETTLRYLAEETEAPDGIPAPIGAGLAPMAPTADAVYESTIQIDVDALSPMVARHPRPDDGVPVGEVAGLDVDQVFIGTCTNGRFDDLAAAAEILRGRKVDRFTRTIVTPASQEVFQKAQREGLLDIFMDAGCTVTQPGCGACIGRHGGILAPGERALTTMNRNFLGRMGSAEAEIYLASPRTAAATAIAGSITDPRTLSLEEVH